MLDSFPARPSHVSTQWAGARTPLPLPGPLCRNVRWARPSHVSTQWAGLGRGVRAPAHCVET